MSQSKSRLSLRCRWVVSNFSTGRVMVNLRRFEDPVKKIFEDGTPSWRHFKNWSSNLHIFEDYWRIHLQIFEDFLRGYLPIFNLQEGWIFEDFHRPNEDFDFQRFFMKMKIEGENPFIFPSTKIWRFEERISEYIRGDWRFEDYFWNNIRIFETCEDLFSTETSKMRRAIFEDNGTVSIKIAISKVISRYYKSYKNINFS